MRTLLTVLLMYHLPVLHAHPGPVSEHLKIDQFGYHTDVQKICVINNPIFGFDNNNPYTPGPNLQLIKASDNALVLTGPATSWHEGDIYDQSGDKAWWFDFSAVTTPGTYYVYDPANDKRSFSFDIRDDVYSSVLKQAFRMFFYQRSGFAKETVYAPA